ncbi:putative nucleic acid-binding protein, contains PIN domain [Dissulfuribacter thermophilus]|uniref:Putative nucleic acid-binding protein, contains PIN domain n=1 Tax=Dissulfuribacter thermophilus TaxID=1156395 RepID=A0A1B9F2N4_9BACT|nr:putative nucleic acid-binding protein, contains PIN domain [Dissulfuribacter thermophilus]
MVDTSVFISSFFGGNPKKVIDLWKKGEITLCLSNKIVDEYIAVLKRLGLQDGKELQELLDIFAEGHHIIFTAKTPVLSIVHDDPDDNKFIECAVALKAQYIISGDQHLKQIENYMGILILNPKKFSEEFTKNKKR